MTDAAAPGARSQLVLEWLGVATAIAYSLLVASNTGFEFLGFVLLFVSSLAIGLWAHRGAYRGILLLQFFYAAAGLSVCGAGTAASWSGISSLWTLRTSWMA